jgi:hypothetical protein
MPLIDIRCANDHETEVYRALAEYPNTPPCPTCGAATEQWHPPPRTRWTADPVIVFRAPDGTYRYPGDASGTQAHRYEKQGYERVEIRSAAEMRAFERRVGQQEYSLAQRRAEIQQAQREQREARNRSNLRNQMQGWSAAGRGVAQAAMARNDAKPLPRARESGFHSEVYSMDRSNRMESRDPQGRRRRD